MGKTMATTGDLRTPFKERYQIVEKSGVNLEGVAAPFERESALAVADVTC